MTYLIDSRSYLKRAKERIDEDSFHSLFYASFELRSGIESRMQQYLEVQEHISKQKKKGWRIADLAKNIEKTFRIGDQITKFTIADKNSGTHLYSLYYTPVTSNLQKQGKKLGNYLHAAKKLYQSNDKWWNEFRENLNKTYRELELANYGTLLGPPLIHPNKKNIDMKIELLPDEDHQQKLKDFSNYAGVIKMKVEYLDSLPKTIKKES